MVPVPPTQPNVKPLYVTEDAVNIPKVDGDANTVMNELVTLPLVLYAVIITAQEVPYVAVFRFEKMAAPVEYEDGVARIPLIVYVAVTDVLVPPDQEIVNPVGVIADGTTLVTGVGNASTVTLPTVPLPDAFVAVMTKGQDVPVNEANVAVPVDELDGVTAPPLMVYVVVTEVPVPPAQVTVNPVVVMSEGVVLVIGVGNASTVTFPTTLPVMFATVIANAQDVPNPVNNVNVAVPVDELEGVTARPLTVYVGEVANSPVAPDHVTVNPLVVIAEEAMLVMGDNV